MIYDKVDMLLMIPTSECMYCMYNYSARSRLELACRSTAKYCDHGIVLVSVHDLEHLLSQTRNWRTRSLDSATTSELKDANYMVSVAAPMLHLLPTATLSRAETNC